MNPYIEELINHHPTIGDYKCHIASKCSDNVWQMSYIHKNEYKTRRFILWTQHDWSLEWGWLTVGLARGVERKVVAGNEILFEQPGLNSGYSIYSYPQTQIYKILDPKNIGQLLQEVFKKLEDTQNEDSSHSTPIKTF